MQIPPFECFEDPEAYYATLAHEYTHWTRHPTRLDRDFGRKRWGDEGYARGELVAELGAAFLCADLGLELEPRPDHASYIASWLKVLKDDKRFIFTAAAHAQRAADVLHQRQDDPARERAFGFAPTPPPPIARGGARRALRRRTDAFLGGLLSIERLGWLLMMFVEVSEKAPKNGVSAAVFRRPPPEPAALEPAVFGMAWNVARPASPNLPPICPP